MTDHSDETRKRQVRSALRLNGAVDLAMAAFFLFFGQSLLGLERNLVVIVAIALGVFAVFSGIVAMTLFRAARAPRADKIVDRR